MSKQDDAFEKWYSFYPRFEDLCKAWDVNAQTVSKKIGVSAATISQWKKSYENSSDIVGGLLGWTQGGAMPSVDSIIKMSLYFNCSTDYLIGTRVNWKAEQIDRVINILSAENQEKLKEYAELLLMKQKQEEQQIK